MNTETVSDDVRMDTGFNWCALTQFLPHYPRPLAVKTKDVVPRVMKVCIVGGGPAGLYTANLLLSRNIETTLHEREKQLGGLYRYSLLPASKLSPFMKMLEDKNFDLRLSSDMNTEKLREIEKDFDAFVIATGAGGARTLAIPGSEHCIKGLDLVRSWFEPGDEHKFGKKVLIIGMGNVSMDIAKFLLGWKTPLFRFPKNATERAASVTDVTVCSRSNMHDSSFTNTELRSVLEIPGLGFSWEGGHRFPSHGNKLTGDVMGCNEEGLGSRNEKTEHVPPDKNGWWNRRKRLFDVIKVGKKNLRLLFNTDVKSVSRCGNKYKIELVRDGIAREEYFDSVISSIGFDTSKTRNLGLKKPVYYVGWARHPKGNIEDAKTDAHSVVNKIASL